MAMCFGAVPVTVSANGGGRARETVRMEQVMQLGGGMVLAMLPGGKATVMLPGRVLSVPVTRLEAAVSVLDTELVRMLGRDSATQP